MVPDIEFECFIRSWFSDSNQDFAEEVLMKQDSHFVCLNSLYYAFLYKKLNNLS